MLIFRALNLLVFNSHIFLCEHAMLLILISINHNESKTSSKLNKRVEKIMDGLASRWNWSLLIALP